MTWQDRLAEYAYTSPSGTRFVFEYTTLERQFDKNTSGYNFPGVAGTYVQDLGSSDHRYPSRFIFWGDDHDLEAQAFEAGLKETGRGKLEHPRDGLRDVVPFGTITFREDLVNAANQTVVDVEFWETTLDLFPQGASDPFAAVTSAVGLTNDSSATDFADGVDISTAFRRVSLADRLSAAVGVTRETLGTIATIETSIARQFFATADSIQLNIDNFIAAPLALARQTQQLLQLPARIRSNLTQQLDTYSTLIASLTGGDDPVRANTNDYRNDELFAIASVGASILSVVSADFQTRPQILNAAATVVQQFEAVNTWREENYAALDITDTGETYQALQDAVALTSGLLIEISFTLAIERRVVLDRARTMIDLCAEFYGEVDAKLNFFIDTNDLSGDEIKEVPAGREVVFYL